MDGKSVTSIFKVPDQLRNQRLVLSLAIVLILLPTLLAHFIFWKVEHRLKLKIYHKPFFVLLPGSVRLTGDFLEWNNRIRVRSGVLTIRYPLTAILNAQFPLRLEGRHLVVEAGPEFYQALGSKQIMFDRVSAKLIIRSKQVDIDFLDAESKTVQFHLKSSLQKTTTRIRN